MTTLIKDISKTQRKINDSQIEQALGAKKIGIKIDTKKAPITLFTLRQFLKEKLISSGGRPRLEGSAKKRNKVPLLEDDWNTLKSLADYYKRIDGISVTPAQLASAIVHSFISNMGITENGILTIIPKPGRAKCSRSSES
ncbi:MAG TPA: hypothetical protein VK469_15750 [Candidatus Kapabacteria bacterium]|nr:hypothetical protein [Candidatus Kapabacteria bacterium]